MFTAFIHTSHVLAILNVCNNKQQNFRSNSALPIYALIYRFHLHVLYNSLQQKVPTTSIAVPNGDCWKRCLCFLVLSFPKKLFYMLRIRILKTLHLPEYQFRNTLIYSITYDIKLFSLHNF